MQLFWLKLIGYSTSWLTWMMLVWGACIGSFLNVCILRIPAGTFFKNSRSVCPSCGAPIPFYLNIPVFSWFILRGRARCCGAKLSFQYPAVEALTAVLFAVIYWKFPFVINRGGAVEWDYANLLRAVHAAIFSSLLIICAVVDFRLMIIPDVISLPMIALTLSWFFPS